MKIRNLIAIMLIIVGALGLAGASFSYTRASNRPDAGSLQVAVNETPRINASMGASVGTLVIGGLLVILRKV